MRTPRDETIEHRRAVILDAIEAIESGTLRPTRTGYFKNYRHIGDAAQPCMACAIGALFYAESPTVATKDVTTGPVREIIENGLSDVFTRIELDVIEEIYMATVQEGKTFWSSMHSDLARASPEDYTFVLLHPDEKREAEILMRARTLGIDLRTKLAAEIGVTVEVPDSAESEHQPGDTYDWSRIELEDPAYCVEDDDKKLTLLNRACMLRVFALMLENNTCLPIEGLYT